MELPEPLQDWLDLFAQPWRPVNNAMLLGWGVVFCLFLLYAATHDPVNYFIHLLWLPIHEGGHLFFGWFGNQTLMIAGGTLMQLFAPFALAIYFASLRQPAATAFCVYFFFEEFLDVAVYMADARAHDLPLVTVGDPGDNPVDHDWTYLFTRFGLLQHDRQIAAIMRFIGWVGMVAVIAWLAWRWHQDREAPRPFSSGA